MKTQLKIQGDPRTYKVKITSKPMKATRTLSNGKVIPTWGTMQKLVKQI